MPFLEKRIYLFPTFRWKGEVKAGKSEGKQRDKVLTHSLTESIEGKKAVSFSDSLTTVDFSLFSPLHANPSLMTLCVSLSRSILCFRINSPKGGTEGHLVPFPPGCESHKHTGSIQSTLFGRVALLLQLRLRRPSNCPLPSTLLYCHAKNDIPLPSSPFARSAASTGICPT